MLTAPTPDLAERRDNATFNAVLTAFSRPGTRHSLPETGASCIALALVDRECRAYADDPALAEVLALTGATMVPPELADHVFLTLDGHPAVERLSRLVTGSQMYPDQGATVVVPAVIGAGTTLRLSGPGIADTQDVALGGVAPETWAVRAHLCRYPLGIEMLFVDGNTVVGLPRSTTVEVL